MNHWRPWQANAALEANEELYRDRFKRYFAKVFAYALSCSGDQTAAKSVTTEAFLATFAGGPGPSDEEFRLALFGNARRLWRTARQRPFFDDALNRRERDALSLLFDAELSKGEVAQLLRLRETTLTATVLRGLLKLREQPLLSSAVAAHA